MDENILVRDPNLKNTTVRSSRQHLRFESGSGSLPLVSFRIVDREELASESNDSAALRGSLYCSTSIHDVARFKLMNLRIPAIKSGNGSGVPSTLSPIAIAIAIAIAIDCLSESP